jgi:putative transposase
MTQTEKPPFDLKKVEEKFKNIKTMEDITGKDGLIQLMVKSTIERILKEEQASFLGYDPHEKGKSSENARNGYSKKTVTTSTGQIEIDVPRDRQGEFESKLLPKYKGLDPTLERQITSMYAKGMSVRDIKSHLEEIYGTDISPTFISRVTDSILEGVTEWQSRPLEPVYAVLFLDAIFFKVRQDSKIINKAAYTCYGIDLNGHQDILGAWVAESEGAHFWLGVLTDLKARGVQDVLIACIDGLKGFSEAIQTIFPKAAIQLCIVHQIRNSLKYVGSQYQKEFLRELKEVYRAPTKTVAESNLLKLSDHWGERYPIVTQSWENNWENLSTYFDYPAAIRKMIYTTNIVEGFHRQLRKVMNGKTQFPNDEALIKMIFLTTKDRQKKWMKPKHGWSEIISQLKLIFGERVHLSLK